MKQNKFTLMGIAIAICAATLGHLSAAEEPPLRKTEYATVRWNGREHTYIIRPGASVEFIGTQLIAIVRPEGVDERSFYMNLAVNGLSKEGFEVVAMTGEEIVMRRVR